MGRGERGQGTGDRLLITPEVEQDLLSSARHGRGSRHDGNAQCAEQPVVKPRLQGFTGVVVEGKVEYSMTVR